MRDAQADVWLASQAIERELREAARRADLPAGPGWWDDLRRRAGEALIATGQRLLPAPRRTPVRAT